MDNKGRLLFSWLSAKANAKVAKPVLLNTKSKKIVTDKGSRYKIETRELEKELKYPTFGKRNVVEGAFIPLKKRMKSFLKDFQLTVNMKLYGVGLFLFLPFILHFLID